MSAIVVAQLAEVMTASEELSEEVVSSKVTNCANCEKALPETILVISSETGIKGGSLVCNDCV